jgi:hypothetical protein
MIKTIFFILQITLSVINIKAQQLVTSAGGSYSSPTLSVTYSVGEIVTETFSGTTIKLTQGFHQPSYTISTKNEILPVGSSIMAFPNPTKDLIKLTVTDPQNKNFSYKVIDAKGQVIMENKVKQAISELPFSSLSPSVYFLKIYENKKEVKTFKIVKE